MHEFVRCPCESLPQTSGHISRGGPTLTGVFIPKVSKTRSRCFNRLLRMKARSLLSAQRKGTPELCQPVQTFIPSSASSKESFGETTRTEKLSLIFPGLETPRERILRLEEEIDACFLSASPRLSLPLRALRFGTRYESVVAVLTISERIGEQRLSIRRQLYL